MSNANGTVRIQIFNVNGILLSDTGDLTLPPLDVTGDTASATVFPAYCRFIVTGSKNNYRATLQVHRFDWGPLATIPAE